MTGVASFDVIVAGAGPGGSTAAALLAEKGHRVLVLEKSEFPRFHIGESLLPGCMPILDRLNIEITPDVFVHKAGAEFVCEESGRTQCFDFSEALPGCAESAWHVDRALFDLTLRNKARSSGAEVRHGVRVAGVDWKDDRVVVDSSGGVFTARFFIDATGQDRLLGRQQGSCEPCPDFGHVAIFTHFEGLGEEALREIGDEGRIRIMLRDEGWGWLIPLPGRRLSVGLVCRGKVQPETLDEGLLSGPLCRRWTKGATRLGTHVARNFSYQNNAPHGPRYAAIGDAAGFLDPVFSSGVTLAMRGAEQLADALGPALDAGLEARLSLHAEYRPPMDRALRSFSALLDRFYHTRFADTVLLGPSTDNTMRHGVMSVLAGDVWRDDNPFQELLLKARPRASRHR
ncbi:MAG: NAD(P)/FAD-dependent oxidoreductase [Planctomycetota bacterium]|nr:NAD(P)/FAD-dependent oxidoreductase [Planctomycetota bacterium]